MLEKQAFVAELGKVKMEVQTKKGWLLVVSVLSLSHPSAFPGRAVMQPLVCPLVVAAAMCLMDGSKLSQSWIEGERMKAVSLELRAIGTPLNPRIRELQKFRTFKNF